MVDSVKSTIALPEHMRVDSSSDSLILSTYHNLEVGNMQGDDFFQDRLILSCQNDEVACLNSKALAIFPGEEQEFLSVDQVVLEDGADANGTRYPIEYLNSLNPAGLPPAVLKVKIGAPVMLLRNLSPHKGLCNGSRLIITGFCNRVIEARILTDDFRGNMVFLSRITLSPSTSEIPFKFQHRQFPIRLVFAMTMNKSQGQSLNFVGIVLRSSVFTHGQLYVALSRCTSPCNIKILYPDDRSSFNIAVNIVYPEVLIQ